MPSAFTLTLDTTGPQGVGGTINGTDLYTPSRDVTLAATTTDPDTTGYQIKVWGDVDLTVDPNIQDTEAHSAWITLTPAIAVRLAAGDGAKTLTWRLRDDVWNASATATDSITLDTTSPVVTVDAGPAPAKISKVAGKDVSSVNWHSDSDYQSYTVRVVPATTSDHTQGTEIPVAAGSTNTGGGAGAGATEVTTTIHGADLESASAGDGDKIVKVFVRDNAGNWSN